MTGWLLICIALAATLGLGFALLALLDPDAIPHRLRRRSARPGQARAPFSGS